MKRGIPNLVNLVLVYKLNVHDIETDVQISVFQLHNSNILSFSIEFHRLSTVKYATGKSASIFTDSDLESKISVNYPV